MGAKTWPCYNQNRVITSSVIKGLKCTSHSISRLLCHLLWHSTYSLTPLSFTYSLSLASLLTHLFIHILSHSNSLLLAHSLTHYNSLTHIFTHSLSHSFTNSLPHSLTLTHSFTCLSPRLLTHSLTTQSLTVSYRFRISSHLIFFSIVIFSSWKKVALKSKCSKKARQFARRPLIWLMPSISISFVFCCCIWFSEILYQRWQIFRIFQLQMCINLPQISTVQPNIELRSLRGKELYQFVSQSCKNDVMGLYRQITSFASFVWDWN